MKSIARARGSVQSLVSAKEWETRIRLAACYRLMHRLGMTDLIYNHITARVPDDAEHLLINAYGMAYSEVTASSLYKIDLDGCVILKPNVEFDLNRAGFILHSAIYAARQDVQCVIHTHTIAGVAVSAMKCGLLPISQTAMRFIGRVGYHDYEGPSTKLDERERLAGNLGDGEVLILRNHGLLIVGPTIHTTFHLTQRLEVACQVQCRAMAAGADLVVPPFEVQTLANATMDRNATTNAIANGGAIEWAALIRELDREDRSYRQ